MVHGHCDKMWCLGLCLAFASFNLLDEKDKKKCFNWISLRPMYSKDDIFKGVKNDSRLYLLQEVKPKCFLKLIDQEGLNEDLHS